MASPARAYPNSAELQSAKSAPPAPSPLVRRIDSSRLDSRLAWTLRSFVIASKQGPSLWASTFAVSIESGRSYRTVQRHVDELERKEVLKKTNEANTYVPGYGMRRTATYALHPHAKKFLEPRESYAEWSVRNRRQAPRAKSIRSAPRIRRTPRKPTRRRQLTRPARQLSRIAAQLLRNAKPCQERDRSSARARCARAWSPRSAPL